jgi:hypothetical protein
MASGEWFTHISFDPVNKSTVRLLKLIPAKLLPIHCPVTIYGVLKKSVNTHSELFQLCDDSPFGEIRWLIETHSSSRKSTY